MGYIEPVRIDGSEAEDTVMPRKQRYHHGDLRNALLDAARAILEEESLANLSLRAVARRAGVSHAAPYRHFPNHEALLVELAHEGFLELQAGIDEATKIGGAESEIISKVGAAYMRFVAKRPALARLMFGPQLPNREEFPKLGEAADGIGVRIGSALHDPALGLSVWASVHGVAMLVLENIIDLGQRASGLEVLPSRAEILLRGMFSTQRD